MKDWQQEEKAQDVAGNSNKQRAVKRRLRRDARDRADRQGVSARQRSGRQ